MSNDIEDRVEALEVIVLEIRDRLTKVETRLDYCATKEDLSALRTEFAGMRTEFAGIRTEFASMASAMQAEINAQTWRMIRFVSGFGTALVAATYFVAKHVG
jgi:hypothetical protein